MSDTPLRLLLFGFRILTWFAAAAHRWTSDAGHHAVRVSLMLQDASTTLPTMTIHYCSCGYGRTWVPEEVRATVRRLEVL